MNDHQRRGKRGGDARARNVGSYQPTKSQDAMIRRELKKKRQRIPSALTHVQIAARADVPRSVVQRIAQGLQRRAPDPLDRGAPLCAAGHRLRFDTDGDGRAVGYCPRCR